jgi:PBSX family phage portal protein
MVTKKEINDVIKHGEKIEEISLDLEGEQAEIEVYNIKAPKRKEKISDPFLKLDMTGLPQHIKRRAARLAKSDGVKSKAKSLEVITGYDILQIVSPPYNLDNLAKVYEQNAAHNAAVTMKAINIVGLGYKWVENPRTQMDIEQAQINGEQDLQDLMKKLKQEKIRLDETVDEITGEEEFNEIMTNVWTDVESMGNGYLEVGRNLNETIGYLGHVPGQTMRIRALRDGFIQLVSNKYTFFRNFGDIETSNPLKNDNQPNEIIHFKKYSPNSTYYGIPDIIPALSAVLGDKLAKQYNIDYFENKSIPRYAFILKGAKLSAKAEENLINYFRNELKGNNHGTLYIPLPASIGQQVDAEFKALEVGVQESSFINYLKENRTEILMAHRVPPGKVSIFSDMNLAVSRDADKTFKEQVCEPEQKRIEKRVNKIVKEFTKHFKLEFIQSNIIDADIKSRIHDRYARIQALKPNEIRSEIGYPTTLGGDDMLPFQKGPNAGGPGQKTSEGAKPRTPSPADQIGQRKQRGEAQDLGEEPAK